MQIGAADRQPPLPLGALLVAVALCLLSAAPAAAAAGAPLTGRWVGDRADGLKVSFVVQAFKGRRYVSSVTWLCARGRPIASSEDRAGRVSYAWPVDRRGTIRDLRSGPARSAHLSARLGRRSGRARLHAQLGHCHTAVRAGFRVRRLGGWLVRSGQWRLSEDALGSAVTVEVLGGAAVTQARGDLRVPRAQGGWSDIGGTICIRGGHGVFPDAWIDRRAAFSSADAPGFALHARFLTSTRAAGAFTNRWTDPRCSTAPVAICAELVRPQPRPRAGRLLLPAPGPLRRACPPPAAPGSDCCPPVA